MLTPVALVEILASVLAAWVLLTLARRSPDPHLRYWSAAFGLQALTTLLISHLQVGREVPWATAISAVVAVLSTTSMVWGTLKYLGAARSKVFAVIPLALIAFSLAGPALDLSFTVRAGVVVVGMAASLR